MISLEDYEALEETAYLLRSPANAKRLIASIEAAEQGNYIRPDALSLQIIKSNQSLLANG